MASVWVDINLSELSEGDLIRELEDRYLDEDEQLQILEIVKNSDSKKLQLFLQIMDKFSVLELEDLFKEKPIELPVPKEQIKLFEC